MPTKIKWKKLSSNVKLPVKGSEGAACYDAYARDITFDHGTNSAIIHLGFATEIPKGWKGVIVPRSSFTKSGWIMANSPGIVDSDYRGEWMMRISPLNGRLDDNGLPFTIGERCCQIYFEKMDDVEMVEVVEELSDTVRNTGGFGSTGK